MHPQAKVLYPSVPCIGSAAEFLICQNRFCHTSGCLTICQSELVASFVEFLKRQFDNLASITIFTSCGLCTASGIVVILLMTQQDTFHLGSVARVDMEKVLQDAGVLQVLKGISCDHPTGQIQIDELPLAAGGAHGRWYCAI